MAFENMGTAIPDTDGALSWDSEIQKDGQEYVLLAPGVYPFTVDHFDRKQYDGGEKIPRCPLAEVHLTIHGESGEAGVIDRLYLHQKYEWKLSTFFRAIGLKKKGETLRMNWNAVPGAKGYVEITQREYNGNKYNNIKKYIMPEDAPAAANTQGTLGKGW